MLINTGHYFHSFYKRKKELYTFLFHANQFATSCKPLDANFRTKNATIGDISIIPSGGTNLRKGSRYGSQMRASN